MDIVEFLKAGKAIFTIQSKSTGQRFTYKVVQPNKNSPYFVSVLTGSDNDSDYTFLGSIFADGYKHGRKSRISEQSTSNKAFEWFYRNINRLESVGCSVWHEGRCGCCGRKLTTPESISSGFGPVCMKKAA